MQSRAWLREAAGMSHATSEHPLLSSGSWTVVVMWLCLIELLWFGICLARPPLSETSLLDQPRPCSLAADCGRVTVTGEPPCCAASLGGWLKISVSGQCTDPSWGQPHSSGSGGLWGSSIMGNEAMKRGWNLYWGG